VEAVQFFLGRIAGSQKLNAFLHTYGQEALQSAKALDEKRKAGHPPGKLHGVIVGIKDIICYKDHPVSAASKMLEGFTSIYNATVVEKLIKEEAIIISHLNCN
jgi:aspartyl-tRNA(Asn)/glutamyl-tRNA(Gln) amidotransferase subunit A